MRIICCTHKYLSPCSVCAFQEMDNIKDVPLYCIIYRLELKIIIGEHGYVGLLR